MVVCPINNELGCFCLLFLQRCSNLSDTDRAHLQSLLFAVINKLKYDEGYKFGSEVHIVFNTAY